MNTLPVVHASQIRPGVRVATIPGPGRPTVTEIDVTETTSAVIEGTTIWTLHDADGNTVTNITGNYHLIGGVTVCLDSVDGDDEENTEFIAVRTPSVPDFTPPAEFEAVLLDWWQTTVFPDVSGVSCEATIVGGPATLVGETFEWND